MKLLELPYNTEEPISVICDDGTTVKFPNKINSIPVLVESENLSVGTKYSEIDIDEFKFFEVLVVRTTESDIGIIAELAYGKVESNDRP